MQGKCAYLLCQLAARRNLLGNQRYNDNDDHLALRSKTRHADKDLERKTLDWKLKEGAKKMLNSRTTVVNP